MWIRLTIIVLGLALPPAPAAAQSASSADDEASRSSARPPTLGLNRSVPSLVQGRPAISARVPRLPDPSPGVQRPTSSLIRPPPSPSIVAPSPPPSHRRPRPLIGPPPALDDQFRDFCRGQAAGCTRDWSGNSHRMLIEQQRQRTRDRRLDQERLRQQRTDPDRR